MSAYPYFSASLPQWTFNAEGDGPSVEAVCAEAIELLGRKDLAVLAYIFSPAYHKIWLDKIRAEALRAEAEAPSDLPLPETGGFEPACLVPFIEQLPYMQAFRADYARRCAMEAAATAAEAGTGALQPAADDADEAVEPWSDTEAYRRLQALFYAQVPALPSAFLKSYYRFDWEWKTVANRLNRKKYPELPMDDRLPEYPAKGDRAVADAEWIAALEKEPLAQLWDYAEDMEKVTAEPDLMKREWLCDSFRWRFAEAGGGDATASTDSLWSYFVRLQLQQRWQRLKKADGQQLLKAKLQSLRAVDWDKNEFSAGIGA
ncbi:MAG: DUF2764 domain-containing protein [Bacteroidales bacterium]|nr:DUF2764 domain-containing protein [Bacteroidales bacterium]